MKLSNLVWSLFGVMALSACSDNDVAEVIDQQTPGNEQGMEGDRFLSVRISNPAGTKADPEKEYEAGDDEENTINNLRFYFFKNDGSEAAVKLVTDGAVNFVDIAPEDLGRGSANTDNVEMTYNAVVVLNTQDFENGNVYQMVAVANFNNSILGDNSLTLEELRNKVGNYGGVTTEITENGTTKTIANFLMTSSSYADEDGQINAAKVTTANLQLSEDAAKANPVNIYIERVVAKTRVQSTAAAVEGKTYNGLPVIALTNNDETKSNLTIKYRGSDTEHQVYVAFTGWNVISTSNMSYLLKKVNSTNLWQQSNFGFIWNNSDFFRSFWAVNPKNDGAGNNFALNYINYKEINKDLGETASAYCQENAANNYETGAKDNYNPAKARSNRTQAIISAVLLIEDEEGNLKPLDLVKWAGGNYTMDAAKQTLVSTIANQIYVKEASETSYSQLTVEDVEFVTALAAGMANTESENSPRYQCYLQLTNKEEATFAKDAEGTQALSKKEVNTQLKTIPGARIWNNGMTYYYTDLRHLGSDIDKIGYYGVVRNHIYDVNVTNVRGLGTPVYNDEENIIPQKPENDEAFIAAQINILSWRVVSNDTELIW